MRFQIILATAFAALASAATSTSSESATSTRAKTPTETCLSKCNPGDTYCQAACVGVPHPNPKATNQTTECVANCDQGDGSAADSKAYGECVQACISRYIITRSLTTVTRGGEGPTLVTVLPGVTTTPSSNSASSTDDSSSSETTSSTKSSSNSASAQTDTSTGGAIINAQAGSIGGVAGLILAALAFL